jgi:uncharacterized cupin superfamily protein
VTVGVEGDDRLDAGHSTEPGTTHPVAAPEARLAPTPDGLVPEGAGWFVVNARDARWFHTQDSGSWCPFEGDDGFTEIGVGPHVLMPGQANGMYHGESTEEAFLVLSGECLLIVEGEERRLRAWDFFHCAPWTEHVLVGAGDGPCAILMVGRRLDGAQIRYPVNAPADRYGASVATETTAGREAYADKAPPEPGAYREGLLPDGDSQPKP